jgi:uncharacterized protein YjhX (UPF0386 family)
MKIKLTANQVIFFLVNMVCIHSHGQTSDKKLPSAMSPEVANLGKYGTYNVNYHTGNADISVPLHSYTENGINISLGLGYDASGFVPNKSAGTVGLNWNLISGGAITRVINGEPDEKNNTNPTTLEDQQDHTNEGYIWGIQHGLGTHPADSIRKLQFLNLGSTGSPGSNIAYEYQPDMFTFNFLGHSGKFFMDNAGNIQVQSDRRYKVDMSGFVGSSGIYDYFTLIGGLGTTALDTTTISRIKITSDDGYIFTFGGALKTLEIGFSYPSNTSFAVTGTSGKINAWYLTKIETPDGNVISYNYQAYSASDKEAIETVVNSGASNGSWNNAAEGNEFLDVKLSRDEKVSISSNGGNNTINSIIKTLTKTAYIKEIVSKNQKLTFIYSEKDRYHRFYKGSDTTLLLYNPYFFTQKLDKIIISDSLHLTPTINITNDGITYAGSKSIEFYYDYVGSNTNGWRMMLNHCTINAPNAKPVTYSFDYYNTSGFAEPLTKGLDLWGYYNNYGSNTSLVGLLDTATTNYEISFPSYADRTPSEGSTASGSGFNSAIGTLTKITYPTGGTTEFVFENHKYRKVLKRTVAAGLTPSLDSLTSDAAAGGLRIKKIVNSPGTTSEYFYVNNYGNLPDVSSGVLLNWGIYFLLANAPTLNLGNNPPFYALWSENNLGPASSYSEGHIEYSQVVEVAGEGYTKNTYSTYATNPDTYNLGDSSYLFKNPDVTANNFNNQLRRMLRYSTREVERGKLLRQEIYKSGQSTPISTIENFYNTDSTRTNQRAIAYYKYVFLPSCWVCNSYANYYYHNQISKQIKTEKDPALGIYLTTTTNYTYKSNSNPLLTQTDMTTSDGTHAITQYKYAEDYSGGIYDSLQNKFMVGLVLEEKIKKDTQSLKTTTYQYYAPMTGRVNLQSVNVQNHQFAASATNPYEVVHFYKYDSSGNAVSASKANDYRLAYKWDFQKTKLVAEIKNAQDTSVSYTSFETSTQDGWTYNNAAAVRNFSAPMGIKAFRLSMNGHSYNITRSISSSITYILSLWHKDSTFSVNSLTPTKQFTRNGWQYNEYEISSASSITISGNGFIDELRLYPKGAFMTTYAYNPFYGMTSQCDINSSISYYEYDGLGRLTLVKDQNKKILKQICYNYSGQAENCTYYFNVDTSKKFIHHGCPSGYDGDSLTYSVTAGTYSSTISQGYVDSLAGNDLNTYGPAYADSNGTCTQVTIYARIGYDNYYVDANTQFITPYIVFFRDEACTIPYSVTNLTVNYRKIKTFCSETQTTTDASVTCNGTSQSLGSQIWVKEGTGTQCYSQEWHVLSGTGYVDIY